MGPYQFLRDISAGLEAGLDIVIIGMAIAIVAGLLYLRYR